MDTKVDVESQQCARSKSSTSKKVLDIIFLKNKEAIRGRRNLILKDGAKRTKIIHKKFTMTSLHKGYVRVVPSDDRHMKQMYRMCKIMSTH